MHALRAHTRGGPEVLRYETAPVPQPAAGEIQVEVHAAAITFAELSWDLTWTREGRDRTPTIPSHEFSGVVSALGAGVDSVEVGTEIYGLVPFDRDGAAAEYVTLPAGDVAAKPKTLDHVATAALPLAGLTAWQALVDQAGVQPGERVLVQGAAGGVGGFVTQLGVALGAVVTGTVRDNVDADTVRGYGAAAVPVRGDLRAALHDHGPFDVVIDTVGGAALELSFAVLRRGGRHVTLSAPPPPDAAARYGITTLFFVVSADADQLAHLAELVDAGRLAVTVADVFDLADGQAAYAGGTDRTRRPGKRVLRVLGS